MKHGTGQFTWPNGDTYKGDYHEDKMHGQGLFVWSNGA